MYHITQFELILVCFGSQIKNVDRQKKSVDSASYSFRGIAKRPLSIPSNSPHHSAGINYAIVESSSNLAIFGNSIYILNAFYLYVFTRLYSIGNFILLLY